MVIFGASYGHQKFVWTVNNFNLSSQAMFRSLPGSTVFYPYDAVSTERAVELAANTKGITFIRVSRPATNVFYDNDEVFEVQ